MSTSDGLAGFVGLVGAEAAVTARAREALAVSVPAVPANWTVAVAAGAEAAAARLTCSGVPGVRVNVAGDAVTPDGAPLIET